MDIRTLVRKDELAVAPVRLSLGFLLLLLHLGHDGVRVPRRVLRRVGGPRRPPPEQGLPTIPGQPGGTSSLSRVGVGKVLYITTYTMLVLGRSLLTPFPKKRDFTVRTYYYTKVIRTVLW